MVDLSWKYQGMEDTSFIRDESIKNFLKLTTAFEEGYFVETEDIQNIHQASKSFYQKADYVIDKFLPLKRVKIKLLNIQCLIFLSVNGK